MMSSIYMFRVGICVCIILFNYRTVVGQSEPGTARISVLAIGNAHYKNFETYPDINYSAKSFLAQFSKFSTPCILESSNERLLSKGLVLTSIGSFVEFVETQPGKQNIGIIYYCGHGIASLSGSMFFIPGDLDSLSGSMSFEMMSSKMISVDDIYQIILKHQTQSGKSMYVILGDCCSNKVQSDLYKGISFQFNGNKEAVVTFDSTFLNNRERPNTSLDASATARFDSLGNFIASPVDSTRLTINEFNFIPELIRSTTMNTNGNRVYYSSEMGKVTEMVASAERNDKNFEVGPICRRTQLFFLGKKKSETKQASVLADYLIKLTDKNFDAKTSPSQLNRTRN